MPATTSTTNSTPITGPQEMEIPPEPFFFGLPVAFGIATPRDDPAAAAPAAGMAKVLPQPGHFPRLPAHSSFTFRLLPHPSQVTEIGMAGSLAKKVSRFHA